MEILIIASEHPVQVINAEPNGSRLTIRKLGTLRPLAHLVSGSAVQRMEDVKIGLRSLYCHVGV